LISVILGFLPSRERPWLEIPMSKSSGRHARRAFSAEFKAKVALEALREDKNAVLKEVIITTNEATRIMS